MMVEIDWELLNKIKNESANNYIRYLINLIRELDEERKRDKHVAE